MMFVRLPPPRLQYAVLGTVLGVVLFSYTLLDRLLLPTQQLHQDEQEYLSRQLSFLDPSVSSFFGDQSTQYSHLTKPSNINSPSVQEVSAIPCKTLSCILKYNKDPLPKKQQRLPPPQAQYNPQNPNDSTCDDILLYTPHDFASLGLAKQLASYLLAALIATYTNKAMVILDAPHKSRYFEGNSQFGCPRDSWTFNANGGKSGFNPEFPGGLSRILEHPTWLSSNCPVPCQSNYQYQDWIKIKETRKTGPYYPQLYTTQEVSCRNEENGRLTKVLVVGGKEVRDYFEGHFKEKMIQRPNDRAFGWAMRLGAQIQEAKEFASKVTEEQNIWDTVSAFIAKSGLIEWQPWIVRDIKQYIESSGLPLDEQYDAIHVRRGDMLQEEGTKKFVERYWEEQVAPDELKVEANEANKAIKIGPGDEAGDATLVQAEEAGRKDYIPFTHYLRQLEDRECNYNINETPFASGSIWFSLLRGGTDKAKNKAHLVYIATDDPEQVQQEINQLPQDEAGYTIINECHKFKFLFSPKGDMSQKGELIYYSSMSTGAFESGFHIQNGVSPKNGCADRYVRTIASIGDLMLVAKSDLFVGEFNSNWGRLVRIFRMQMNADMEVGDLEMKVAWGNNTPLPPGV